MVGQLSPIDWPNLHQFSIETPIGPISITHNATHLLRIEFNTQHTSTDKHPLSLQITQALNRYLNMGQHQFHLPLRTSGTPFQQTIWRALQNIPRGETRSYGELAKQLKTSPRAVGNACRQNPIPIIIPCHRVIAQNHLGGFAGQTKGTLINIKTWLLNHEGNTHHVS